MSSMYRQTHARHAVRSQTQQVGTGLMLPHTRNILQKQKGTVRAHESQPRLSRQCITAPRKASPIFATGKTLRLVTHRCFSPCEKMARKDHLQEASIETITTSLLLLACTAVTAYSHAATVGVPLLLDSPIPLPNPPPLHPLRLRHLHLHVTYNALQEARCKQELPRVSWREGSWPQESGGNELMVTGPETETQES